MKVENPKMTYTVVDKVQYGLVWFDRGDHWHLKIFRDDNLLGFKNFKIGIDTGDGVTSWAIRATLNEVANGLKNKKA